MTEEAKTWLEEMSRFLCTDAWSEERILEILINIWLDGYNEKQKETANV
jgi:Fe-S-cluster formation regulator IscX/YfhJ